VSTDTSAKLHTDEYHGRALGSGLSKQVPHARGAHADEHLHEVGAADGEEGHPRLARRGLGQQRLAGPCLHGAQQP
jgi:hypothetical protein